MKIEDLPTAVGTALGAAGLVVMAALRWRAKSDAKIDGVNAQIETPEGVPSLASLVMSTAESVQRLESSSQRNGAGISQIIETQRKHGEQLERHDARITKIEAHPSFGKGKKRR